MSSVKSISINKDRNWITCLGIINTTDDNSLFQLCINKLSKLTNFYELNNKNYPEHICMSLRNKQLFFSSGSDSILRLWYMNEHNKIIKIKDINNNCWTFSYVVYKNYLILGLKNGRIEIRDINNIENIVLNIILDDGICYNNIKSLLINKSQLNL